MRNGLIPNQLVAALHDAYWAKPRGGCISLTQWAERENIAERDAVDAYCELADKGWATEKATIGIWLTGYGVMQAELCGLVSKERAAENIDTRFRLLDALAKFAETNGTWEWISLSDALVAANIAEDQFLRNLMLLIDNQMICWDAANRYLRIDRCFLPELDLDRTRRRVRSSYNALKSVCSPAERRARGHELERLLADIFQLDGWMAETNVRGPGEEYDLIIWRDDQVRYFVECKWVQDPIEGADLSILRDRITGRKEVRGLFFSVSGFTSEATKSITRRINDTVMLLFGPDDIEKLLTFESTLEDLIHKKYHVSIIKLAVLIDGTISN